MTRKSSAADYNLAQDLEYRSRAQAAEIIWISGPSAHDAEAGARRMGVSVPEFKALVQASIDSRKSARR